MCLSPCASSPSAPTPTTATTAFGGLAVKYARLGHRVKFVSLSNGNAGHFSMGGGPLARGAYEEAQRSAAIAGVEYELLDINDARSCPLSRTAGRCVRLIREFKPDLVVTNRPNDYHPDHRYTAQLVADAAYTVTIPNVQPLTPHLRYNPVIAYWADDFTRPYPFTPDVAVSIDDVADAKIDMLELPRLSVLRVDPLQPEPARRASLPAGPAARVRCLRRGAPRLPQEADRYRDLLPTPLRPRARRGASSTPRRSSSANTAARSRPRSSRRLFPFFG